MDDMMRILFLNSRECLLKRIMTAKKATTKRASTASQGPITDAKRPRPSTTTTTTTSPSYFLMKSEPDVFSIDDLSTRPNQTEPWDGVRNHQAKKILQTMQLGDRAFFYHSNAKPPGIIGLVTIVREAYPDPAQFDSKSKYYDAKSSKEQPKWVAVDVKLERKLERLISLDELKVHRDKGGELGDMSLFKYSRLSVQPVEERHWDYILGLEHAHKGDDSHHPSGPAPS